MHSDLSEDKVGFWTPKRIVGGIILGVAGAYPAYLFIEFLILNPLMLLMCLIFGTFILGIKWFIEG